MTSVSDNLRWAEQALAETSLSLLESCKVDSLWLLGHVLQRNAAWLRAWPEFQLNAEQAAQFESLIARRKAGEPVAYLTGLQGFWTLELEVTSDTLVPRPDTELLVEHALSLVDDGPSSVLDLGTGSGAIALALAYERPLWQVTATDVYEPTLQVAKRNADRLQLAVNFVLSSWFVALANQQFDLIVSNPPYIESGDAHLGGLGVCCEPLRALASGEDGLNAIREIVQQAPCHLNKGGWLLLEHGYEQGDAVRELMQAYGFSQLETLQDLADNDRVTVGRLKPC
jgi:release factor glutamine methyltransferase